MTTPNRPASGGSGLKVIGDSGVPVDWWFIYKISGKSTPSPEAKPPTGKEYLYYDAGMAAKSGKPVFSTGPIDTKGALFDTFSQLFTPAAKANKLLGWFCYNDEDRLDAKGGGTGPDCGHCKGALAFDLATDTAFWLIHSVPLMVMDADFVYPETGHKEAQTLLCIQLANADTARDIAQLLYEAHGPNVNVASDLLTTAHDPRNRFRSPPISDVPAKLGDSDPRVKLMRNINGSSGPSPQPYSGRAAFASRGGQKFIAIGKNRIWGDPKDKQAVKDFYNDLVGVVLEENLEVETWQNVPSTKVPPAVEHGEKHDVENVKSVNLAPLGIPYSWKEELDHAKLAISDRHNPPDKPHYVCVGDINFTDSMEQRGGGTVAFVCEPLWKALTLVLVEGTPGAGAGHAKPS